MKIIYLIWHRYSAVLLLAAVAFVLAATYAYSIREDEAWIGEQAYWLYKEGRIYSVLWQGYYKLEQEVAVHHYLFVRLTAWLLELLPWDVLSLRLIPLLSGFLLTGAIMLFASTELKWNRRQACTVGALFILIPINFEYLTYYRPEFVVTLFGFGSFWALFNYRKQFWFAPLAGLLAGLAMLTHLNGMVFVLAGGAMLLFKRDARGVVLFGLAAGLAFLPFLLEIISNWELFRYQLSAGANTAGRPMTWYSPLLNLVNEQKRLFRGPYTIFTSALLLASIVVHYQLPKDAKIRFALHYMLLVLVFLGMFAVSKTSQYSIVFYPQAALLIAATLFGVYQQGKRLHKAARYFYQICWFAFTFFVAATLLIPFVTPQPDIKAANHRLSEGIPAGKRFLAPMAFIFNRIDRYEILALTTLFELDHYDLTVEDFIIYTQQKQIDYLVLNNMWKGRIRDLEQERPIFEQHFQEIKTSEGLTLYRVRQTP